MLKKSPQTLINSGKVTKVTKGNRKGNRYLPLYIYLLDIFIYVGYLVTSFPRSHVGIYISRAKERVLKKCSLTKSTQTKYIYPTHARIVCKRGNLGNRALKPAYMATIRVTSAVTWLPFSCLRCVPLSQWCSAVTF